MYELIMNVLHEIDIIVLIPNEKVLRIYLKGLLQLA